MRIHHHLSLALALAAPAGAQVSIFQPAATGAGDVLVLDTGFDSRPSELQGIELLSLDCIGRTRFDELGAESCRRLSDVPGAARLSLPRERGSLYRFRRRDAAGAAYGYFLVDRGGGAFPLFELRGTGPAGLDDPLTRRVAVARDGRSMLVASSPEAGGDVYEVELTRHGSVNRTEDVPPLDVQRNGLALLADFGAVLTTGGVFRFQRQPFAQVEALALPTPRNWFGADLVASGDQSTVAFAAGTGQDRALLFTLGRSGPILQASERSMPVRGAGYLPDAQGGPWMALSSDGSFLAWCSDEELYVHETGVAARPADLHLSGDAVLESTLNDTGVLAFFDGDSLLFAAGREGSEGVEKGDLFRIDLTRGASTYSVTNLTRTSGQSAPPFDYGTLRVRDGLRLVPGGAGELLLHERRPDEHGFLRRVTPDGTVSTVFDHVSAFETAEVAGRFLAVTVVRPPGVDDPLLERRSLLQLPLAGLVPQPILLPAGSRLTRRVGSRSLDRFAGVLEVAGSEQIGRIALPAPLGFGTTAQGLVFGPTTSAMVDGSFVGTTTILGIPLVFRWSDAELSVLRLGTPGFVLPGL